MNPRRPAEHPVEVSLEQPTDAPGLIAPLTGLATFGDPDAGACIDGVCAIPDDAE